MLLVLQLPNKEFWANLAGLVRDGASFSIRGSAASDPLLAAQDATLQSKSNAANARALQEQRDQSVHSSQQPITVVTEPTRRQEPLFTETIEKYGDENQLQLKATLEQQGTPAAKLGLRQLETLVLKQQLKKLGLSTTGTAMDLEARLRQAT